MNYPTVQSERFPLLAKEGWPRYKQMVPFRKGADGVVAHNLCFVMRVEMCSVSDHPVCGLSVASRLFIDAAATPPLQGGEIYFSWGEHMKSTIQLMIAAALLFGMNAYAHHSIVG